VKSQEGIKDEGLAPAVVDEGKQVVEEKKDEDENKVLRKWKLRQALKAVKESGASILKETLIPNVPVENGASEGTYTVHSTIHRG
jgi:hypothetical protein